MNKLSQSNHKDNEMYDHFGEVWIPLEINERKEWINAIKGIGYGLLVSILIFVISLTILCGLFR